MSQPRRISPLIRTFHNSPCFYNLEEIDRWIERQASARPRRHLT
ncbi:excisionase family protein [Escherichia coli]|nr:excisionase [Escherichia coli M718]TEZ08540.1 hypothetical protein BON65_26330 [Escherichia coli]